MRPLDEIDCDILSALQKNARLSNKELAARVGIAQSTCLERVRRLQSEGVLRGFHASVAPSALGIGMQAMIAVRLRDHAHKAVAAFQERMAKLPELLHLYHLAGATDFLLHVAVRDTRHLREVTVAVAQPDISHLETSLIFEHVASPEMPVYAELEA